MRYLLDTCVISELIARRPQAQVVQWVDSIDDERLYLSVITIGEIQRGIAKLPASPRREALNEWLREDLLHRFQGRVVPVDTPTILVWGELVARLEAKGRILPAIDSLIAAIALQHDLQLVTRNERDFDDTGVAIVNPWGE